MYTLTRVDGEVVPKAREILEPFPVYHSQHYLLYTYTVLVRYLVNVQGASVLIVQIYSLITY